MPSMSYCMFENTVNEFDQVLGAMEEAIRPVDLELSSSEDAAIHDLRDACQAFLEEYNRLFPDA